MWIANGNLNPQGREELGSYEVGKTSQPDNLCACAWMNILAGEIGYHGVKKERKKKKAC